MVFFSSWYTLIYFLSGSLLYSTFQKIVFNAWSKPGIDNRVPYDLWTKLDTLSALCTLIGFPIIANLEPEYMIVKEDKDWVDALMLTIVVL